MSIEKILTAREKAHGSFKIYAYISRGLKRYMADVNLSDVEREALEMIFSKAARILAGNPHEIDHWQDIAGYATLVVKDLKEIEATPNERI